MVMKFENLLLQGLFGICLLLCVATLASMLAFHPSVSSTAASTAHVAAKTASAA
jgi:hypothetical protein